MLQTCGPPGHYTGATCELGHGRAEKRRHTGYLGSQAVLRQWSPIRLFCARDVPLIIEYRAAILAYLMDRGDATHRLVGADQPDWAGAVRYQLPRLKQVFISSSGSISTLWLGITLLRTTSGVVCRSGVT
jgi:hypothetical protein